MKHPGAMMTASRTIVRDQGHEAPATALACGEAASVASPELANVEPPDHLDVALWWLDRKVARSHADPVEWAYVPLRGEVES